LREFVPERPVVNIFLSDEVRDFAEQRANNEVRNFDEQEAISLSDEDENFAEHRSILLNNRQKIVEKKSEKSELFFLRSK